MSILKRTSRIGRQYSHGRYSGQIGIRKPSPMRDFQLPPSVDLRPQFPPCYDQGSWGTCTENAVAGVLHAMQPITARWMPSRLYLAYEASTVHEEDGVTTFVSILDPCMLTGYTEESLWPYDQAHLDIAPNATATFDAAKHRIGCYARVPDNDLTSLKTSLALGKPVLLGVQCYAGFEDAITASTGDVPTPGWWERLKGCLGGHGIVAVGYDDKTQRIRFRNSWGIGWGCAGYGTIGYDYFTNSSLSNDCWTISSLVETP